MDGRKDGGMEKLVCGAQMELKASWWWQAWEKAAGEGEDVAE